MAIQKRVEKQQVTMGKIREVLSLAGAKLRLASTKVTCTNFSPEVEDDENETVLDDC